MKLFRPPNKLFKTVLIGIFCVSSPLCLAAAPAAIQFMVKHFSVEGASPLSPTEMDNYLQPLQQRQYTLKTLQEAGKGLEEKIREQGHPCYLAATDIGCG